ncbi:MAG: hypothetical protein CR975_01370 [Gammaproteobacteria bacterium]|nr:MAG: hypothetical protein CR975_01370 [Gammaproteobacteria bacterium]
MNNYQSNFQGKNQQQGLALIASLLIIIIFAIMGMTAAQKAKESEFVAGADVRYGATFEAAEQTLRRAMRYLNDIDAPKAGAGNTNRTVAENFNMTNTEGVDFATQDTFIWTRAALRGMCGTGCRGFAEEIDNNNFWQQAVKSTFTSGIDASNYLNDIETYTFVEELARPSSTGLGESLFGDGILDAGAGLSTKPKEKAFYLVTVKASGFPPGTTDANKTALTARENVIIQTVVVKFE